MKTPLLTILVAGTLSIQTGWADQSTHVGTQVLEKDQIVEMLQPKMKTRGIRINQPAQTAATTQQADQATQQNTQAQQNTQNVQQDTQPQPAQQENQAVQQVAAVEPAATDNQGTAVQDAAVEQVAAVEPAAAEQQPAPAPPPTISMEINFPYNSAQLTSQAIQQLIPLGEALRSPELAGLTFILEGHTDATGPDGYNMTLSQMRAQSVGQFLYQNYGVNPNNLSLIGRGESALLDPSNPTSGVNRRVSITTLTN